MFSKKLGLVAIALVAELCAAGGSTLLTLCVHEDGSVRYEPTLALCCKQNDRGQGECCSHEEGRSDETHGIVPEKPCQDYGVSFAQVIVTRPSIKQFLPDGSVLREFLPIRSLAILEASFDSSGTSRSCGPPEDRHLLELSTVVLRI